MSDGRPAAAMATPASALKHANTLALANDTNGAAAFLQTHRGDWTRVPPVYDATLGTLLLRSGDPKSAIPFLRKAVSRFRDHVPEAVRRALGTAYLQLGRIETAGQAFSQLHATSVTVPDPMESLAIEAFQNRASESLDSGPPTAFAILTRAKVMEAAGNKAAATKLLASSRKSFTRVPPAYDNLLRALKSDGGEKDARVARLLSARDEAAGALPVATRHALGMALFEVGRVEEAGKELSIALDGGADIRRLDVLVAANSYRLRTGSGAQLDTSFGKGFTFLNEEKNLAYISMPKNASSLLKSMFVLNSPYRSTYLESKSSIHDFCDTLNASAPSRQKIMADGCFRFTVLRDPARRLLSAYLDKFVRGLNSWHPPLRAQQMAATIRVGQQLASVPYDPQRSITFEEFVRYVAQADDSEFNMHWMPQWRIVGRDLSAYSHVGTVERLKQTLDLLTERFDFDQNVNLYANLPKAATHIAKHSAESDMTEPFQALPALLAQHVERLPLPEHFLPPAIRAVIAERFAIDEDLYRAASA